MANSSLLLFPLFPSNFGNADSTPISVGAVNWDPAVGPAFQAELKGIISDKILFGDVGTFFKDFGIGVYDTFSPSVSLKETAKQYFTAIESGVGVIFDKLGTLIDAFNLLTVPEVVK